MGSAEAFVETTFRLAPSLLNPALSFISKGGDPQSIYKQTNIYLRIYFSGKPICDLCMPIFSPLLTKYEFVIQ